MGAPTDCQCNWSFYKAVHEQCEEDAGYESSENEGCLRAAKERDVKCGRSEGVQHKGDSAQVLRLWPDWLI
jgi:hypothetical protein